MSPGESINQAPSTVQVAVGSGSTYQLVQRRDSLGAGAFLDVRRDGLVVLLAAGLLFFPQFGAAVAVAVRRMVDAD